MSASWIGRPLRRFEDRRLVTGAGKYVEDVRIADLWHVAVLRSPYAHARLISIDVSKARQAPGVIDVITGTDVEGEHRLYLWSVFRHPGCLEAVARWWHELGTVVVQPANRPVLCDRGR